MTIANARLLVRQFAKNAGSSSMYSDTDIDNAIKYVCTRFCRITHYLLGTGTISLTAASDTATTSTVTDFKPERLLYALCSTAITPMVQISYLDLWQKQQKTPYSGVPEYLAFDTETAGHVYPTPSANATLKLYYWQPFNLTSMNLPDDVFSEILPTGATAILQHADPEMLYASASWQQYLAVEASYTGSNTQGSRLIEMGIE